MECHRVAGGPPTAWPQRQQVLDHVGAVTLLCKAKPFLLGIFFFFFFGIHLFNVGQKLVYTDSVVLQRPTKVKSVCLRGKGESIRSP